MHLQSMISDSIFFSTACCRVTVIYASISGDWRRCVYGITVLRH